MQHSDRLQGQDNRRLNRNGVSFRQCDGSFEDYLFHEGVPYTACTETPGMEDINRRVEANTRLMEEFANIMEAAHEHPNPADQA